MRLEFRKLAAMRIWLATVGEPLPTDPGSPRLLRTALFAEWLTGAGHDVTFFTGSIDHYARQLRSVATETRPIRDNYRIVLLASRLYLRTMSYARFMNHADVAKSFRAVCGDFATPDVIVSSYPTEELCRAILDHAQPLGVPVVIDVRDFWPDIFSELLPRPLRFLTPMAFGWLDRAARRTLGRATALSAMTESGVDWALAKAGRERGPLDFSFPFSYSIPHLGAIEATRELGGVRGSGLRFCFLGTLSHRSNLEAVVKCFRLLAEERVEASVVICGRGEAEPALRALAAGADNISFLGWLDARQLASLMRLCDLGLLPYSRPDFHLSIPNKFVEYLAGSLPVLSCTEGEVRTLLAARECGVWAPPTPRAMADAIANLVRSPDRIATMKRNAQAVFRDTFDAEIVFSRTFAKLTDIVGSSQG